MSTPEKYTVVRRGELNISAAFEGDANSVVEWLKRQDDVTAYEVYSYQAKTYYSISDFLTQYVAVVDKFYMMDPKTEEFIPDGRSLADGMVVLIADSKFRGRFPDDMDLDWSRDRLLENNRWCTVSGIRIKGDAIMFVASYSDGTKRKRQANIEDAWFVKKDSIADSMSTMTARYNSVHQAVLEALDAQESEDLDHDKFRVAEETTKKILGLL